jgi:DNA repair exonuclease SbcCD nuclease subunit
VKILHTADWHANCNYEKFLKSVDQIYQNVNQYDLMVYSGDLFDSKITASHLYNNIVNIFCKFANHIPIFMVYGTPSHDYKGSLDIFTKTETKYPIKVINSIKDSINYFNSKSKDFCEKEEADLMLVGCPWPLKSRFLKDSELRELDFKEQQELYRKRFQIWRKKVISSKSNIATILVAHLQLIGSIPAIAQDISSDNHAPEDFYELCDYGALGHIHKAQNFKNLYYSGSIYNKTWGELEEKCFNQIQIKDNKISSIEQIKLDTPVMLKMELSIDEYEKIKKEVESSKVKSLPIKLSDPNNLELWIIVNLNEKKSYNKETEINFWNKYSKSVRFEMSRIKSNVIERMETYNKDMSLLDKFKKWCEIKNIKPSEFQINKIKEIN